MSHDYVYVDESGKWDVRDRGEDMVEVRFHHRLKVAGYSARADVSVLPRALVVSRAELSTLIVLGYAKGKVL